MIQTNTNTTQIFVFFSLVPVLKKLPDHQNLALFNDMLQILVPVTSISIRTLGFFVSIKTISFDIKLI